MLSQNTQPQSEQTAGLGAMSGRRKFALVAMLLLFGYAAFDPSLFTGATGQPVADGETVIGDDLASILNNFDQDEASEEPLDVVEEDSPGLIIPTSEPKLHSASFQAPSEQPTSTEYPIITPALPTPTVTSPPATPEPQIRLTGTISPLN